MALNIISYNISKAHSLYDVIERYILKKSKNTIILLQESPISSETELKIRSKDRYSFFHNKEGGNVITLYTNDLSMSKIGPFECPENKKRYQIISSKIGKIVNVHMHSRTTNSSAVSKNTLLTCEIKNLLGNNSIVGGDFNNNPFDSALIGPDEWYAKRTRTELVHINAKKGFINPFWRALSTKFDREPVGTIVGDHNEPVVKPIFDQILISHTYLSKMNSFGVIHKLGGDVIKELNESITDATGSKHWPVYLSLNMGAI